MLECFYKPDFDRLSQQCLSYMHSNSPLLHAPQSACGAKSAKAGLRKLFILINEELNYYIILQIEIYEKIRRRSVHAEKRKRKR